VYHPSSGALSGEAPAQPPTCAYGTLTSRFPVTNRPHSWAIHARRAGAVEFEELALGAPRAAAGQLWVGPARHEIARELPLPDTRASWMFRCRVLSGMLTGDRRAFDPRKWTSAGETGADILVRNHAQNCLKVEPRPVRVMRSRGWCFQRDSRLMKGASRASPWPLWRSHRRHLSCAWVKRGGNRKCPGGTTAASDLECLATATVPHQTSRPGASEGSCE
jgi:hypothetical protein